MFGIGLVELALVIVVPALAATMCVALATRPRGTFSVAREWRWVRRIRLLGIALGLLIATVLMDHASLAAGGVGTIIAPPGFGLGVLGSTRTEYAHVVSLVDHVARAVSEILRGHRA